LTSDFASHWFSRYPAQDIAATRIIPKRPTFTAGAFPRKRRLEGFSLTTPKVNAQRAPAQHRAIKKRLDEDEESRKSIVKQPRNGLLHSAFGGASS
jgi:hypothetical protein